MSMSAPTEPTNVAKRQIAAILQVHTTASVDRVTKEMEGNAKVRLYWLFIEGLYYIITN